MIAEGRVPPERHQLPHWNRDRLAPGINQVPRPRDAFWIGASLDALEPEFTGYHPGVIIRGARSLEVHLETVSFVPLTTVAPRVDPETGRLPHYVHQLSANPNPRETIPVWAICNHILTARLTKLELYRTMTGGVVVPRISTEDFAAIMEAIRRGYGVIGNHVKELMAREKEAYKAELDAAHAARLAELEAAHEARLAEVEMEINRRATALFDEAMGT